MRDREINPYAPTLHDHYAPMEPSGNAELATLGQRFLGALIDGFLLLIIVLAIAIGLGILLVILEFDVERFEETFLSEIIGFVIGFSSFLALQGYFLYARCQTIGKMVMKTRIVGDDGAWVPFGRMIMRRYLPFYVISAIPIIKFLAFVEVLFVFGEERKCLHDRMAETKVIRV